MSYDGPRRWDRLSEIEKAATLYVKARQESAIMAVHLRLAKEDPSLYTLPEVQVRRDKATKRLRKAWARLARAVPTRHDLWFMGYMEDEE